MRVYLIDQLDFYNFETGPRLTALKKTRPLADGHEGAEVLRLRLDEAIERDSELFALERAWRQRKRHKVQHSERALVLDRELDTLLGGLEETLSGLARLKNVDLERGQAAEDMLRELFPSGIGALIQGRFEDQAHATDGILAAIDAAPRFQKLLGELGLEQAIQTIRALNAEYFAEIESSKPLRLEDLEELRHQGQLRLGSIVARIFGLYPEETAADQKARAELLAPIERQNEKLRAIYKERVRGRRDELDAERGEATPEAA